MHMFVSSGIPMNLKQYCDAQMFLEAELYTPDNLYGTYPYVARVREVLSPYFAELKRNLAFDFSL